MWTRITKLRYIKFLLCKFHSRMTIFSWICYWKNMMSPHFHGPIQFMNCINIHFYKTSDAKKSTSITCTSRILWETDHYFGSTKLCCLTFRDPYIFITLLMPKNLVLMQKKGANFQFKNNCWHYFIRCLSLMVLEHVVLVD